MAKELKSITFPGLPDIYEISSGDGGLYPILKANIIVDGGNNYPPAVFMNISSPDLDAFGSSYGGQIQPYKTDSSYYWFKIPTYGSCYISWEGSGAKTKTISVNKVSMFEAIGSLIQNFADTSWADIVSACQSNTVPADWKVGDSKAIDNYTVTIIGKNHDVDSSGNTCPLTLQVTAGPEYDTIAGTSSLTDGPLSYTNSAFWAALNSNGITSGIRSVKGKSWNNTHIVPIWYPSATEILGNTYVNEKLKSGSTSSTSGGVTTTSGSNYTDTDSIKKAYAGSQYKFYEDGNVLPETFLTRSSGTMGFSNQYTGGDQKVLIYINGSAHGSHLYACNNMGNPTGTASYLAAWVFCL